ncbi:MAG: adenylate kinase [Chitinophagaceae bacterium]|nr:adenylate kinase [Chitinophagaceae bacterium]
MFNLILFGPPGSGKGTQSEKLIEKYGWKHLSTGDLLRQEMKTETKLGREAKEFIQNGQLVPDSVVIGMIESALEANPNAKGFLFDGFPRTVAQAEALDRLLEQKQTAIHSVLFLHVNQDELIHRLIGRAKTSGRLDDADPEIQRRRQEVYRNETLPVAEYYQRYGKVEHVKGEGAVEDIFQLLCTEIDQKQ